MRRVRYRRITVAIEDASPPEKCEVCGRKCKPRGMHRHHFIYAYTTEQVRQNPKLALDNSADMCFPCHRVANAEQLLQKTKPEIRAQISMLHLERCGVLGVAV